MSAQLQAAQAELIPDVEREIDWFVTPGERAFVGGAAIGAAAGALLGAFFSGMIEVLKGEAHKEGESLGKWIVERLRSITSGKEGTDQTEVERDATKVQANLQGLDHKQVMDLCDRVEGELRSGFMEVMPEQRATGLAARVRHVSVTVIYQVG